MFNSSNARSSHSVGNVTFAASSSTVVSEAAAPRSDPESQEQASREKCAPRAGRVRVVSRKKLCVTLASDFVVVTVDASTEDART